MYLYTLSAGYIQYTRRDVRLHKTHHLQAKIKPENDKEKAEMKARNKIKSDQYAKELDV